VDFGKLQEIEGVDFSLPREPPRTGALLARSGPAPDSPWLVLGAPAWARRDWIGKLYPAGTSPRDLLRAYARVSGAIELNASYYSVPEEHVLDGWIDETPPDFSFCPKLQRGITHDAPLAQGVAAAADFARRLRRLGERLGPFLVQLPPWFTPSDLPALDAVLGALAAPAHVEFRHAELFRRGELHPGACAVLERHGAGAVITDVAGRRDVCHATLTAPELMLRFVGNGLHPTDLTRVDAWLDRLADWRARGLRRVFFFVHQPDDHLAPELMQAIGARAAKRGLPVHLPRARGQLALL
jgi:uncharacterized protein YecE (DUF72 family)